MDFIKSINIEFTEEFKIVAGCLAGIIFEEDESTRLVAAASLFKALQDANASQIEQMLFLGIASAAYKGNTPDERLANAKIAASNLCKPEIDKFFSSQDVDKKFDNVMKKMIDKVHVAGLNKDKEGEEDEKKDDKEIEENNKEEEDPIKDLVNSFESFVKILDSITGENKND